MTIVAVPAPEERAADMREPEGVYLVGVANGQLGRLSEARR